MTQREQLYSEIPEELQEAEELLREYGRWARGGRSPGRCGSAERAYRSKQDDLDRQPAMPAAPPSRIAEINRALQAVPEAWRIVLMWIYVNNDLSARLRAERIPARIARERHLEGVRMFWNNWRKASCYKLVEMA